MEELENPFASPTSAQSAEVPPQASPPAVDSDELVLADRGSRLIANIIDGIIGLFVAIVVMQTSFYLVGQYYPLEERITGPMSTPVHLRRIAAMREDLGWLYYLICAVVSSLLFLALHGYLLATKGQTLGKRQMGIKIVNWRGNRVPLARLFVMRYLAVGVLSMIPTYGVGVVILDALLIFRKSRRCLHDEIADTNVVRA